MGQGIADGLQHLAVELGLAALGDQPHLLAEAAGEIAHHPLETGPGLGDGLHPRPHHRLAQLGGNMIEPLERAVDLTTPLTGPQQLVAGEHELAHLAHERIQKRHRHP